MPRNFADLDVLESLRESGDYEKLAALLTDEWQVMAEFDENAIRLRLLASELSGPCRAGSMRWRRPLRLTSKSAIAFLSN